MTNSDPAHQRKRGATVSLPEQSSSGSHCDGGPGSQYTGPGLCADPKQVVASSILKEQVWQCPANIKESQWSVLKQSQRPSITRSVSRTEHVYMDTNPLITSTTKNLFIEITRFTNLHAKQ